MVATVVRSLGIVAALLLVGRYSALHGEPLPSLATTEQTVFLRRIDVDQMDYTSLQGMATKLAGPMAAMAEPTFAQLKKTQAGLKELGVTSIVHAGLLLEGENGPQQSNLVLFLCDPAKTAQAKEQIAKFWYPAFPEMFEVGQEGNWLALAVKGTLEKLDGTPGEHVERIEAALKSLGNRPGAVFVPSNDIRKFAAPVKAGMAQDLPPSVIPVADGILSAEWVSIAAKIDADPAIKFSIKAQDAASAEKLVANYKLLNADLQKALKNPPQDAADLPGGFNPIQPVAKITAVLEPRSKGDSVTILIDKSAMVRLLPTVLAPVMQARNAAQRMMSANNVKQILLAILNFEAANGKLPDTLDQLKPYLTADGPNAEEQLKRVLTNPETGEYPGYLYKKPADKISDVKAGTSNTVVVQELKDGKPDPNGQHGYLDGSVRKSSE